MCALDFESVTLAHEVRRCTNELGSRGFQEIAGPRLRPMSPFTIPNKVSDVQRTTRKRTAGFIALAMVVGMGGYGPVPTTAKSVGCGRATGLRSERPQQQQMQVGLSSSSANVGFL